MRMLNYLNYIFIAVIGFATCEDSRQKLEEIAIESLHCRENTCTKLKYPLAAEVAYFSERVTKHLRNYESLVLYSSHLANLPRKLFLNLPQLVEFHVLECGLQQIERECFEGAQNLRRLNFGGNALRVLDRNTFELATQLEELNLSDNQIEDLPTTIFRPLRNLQRINLSNNRLMTISQHIFSQLGSLKSINLDSNQLRELPGELFSDQQKHLSDFSARNNQLARIPLNMFSEIDHLSLSFNRQLRSLHLSAEINELEATNCGLESVKLDGRVVGVQLETNLYLNELKISQPQDLEHLYLANTNLYKLDFLSKATKLVDLDVTGIVNLADLPKITSAKGLERLSFTYDNLTSDNMDMLPHLKDLNYLEISHEEGREIFIKDLDEDFFVEEAELNCGQLADLLEFELPKDTAILEDRLVGDPRGPMRCGMS